MPYYRSVGDVSAKRHTHHVDDEGHRLAEELMGQEGFSSNSSLLYHRRSPSALVRIEPIDAAIADATPDVPLTPRHIRTGMLDGAPDADAVTGRRVLLANDELEVAWVNARDDSALYRNAVGDELVYLQHGDARLDSVFGRLDVGPGDYVVVPASTTHRWIVRGDGPLGMLVIVSRGHVAPPAKYLSRYGQFLEHAPYCERDLRAPTELVIVDDDDVRAEVGPEGGVPVLVRNRAGWSCHVHRHHPFDVVGWDGCVYPYAFNIADFEPIVGRLHQPPPVHQTFELPGAVVCSFVPRLFDFHPDAVKVPYHHANTDSDEVLFYSAGNFMSRAGSGIDVGSISYHPAGFVHGPQPGSVEASLDQTATEEVAVMIDTFAPLRVTDTARAASDEAYPFTWSR
ncbi:MAG TPA: cupin domain-containing protein [Ilumatobacteraceae bacterium]|nr:cupin domain-containing protein [Ilumatobacteraceae bacterium]